MPEETYTITYAWDDTAPTGEYAQTVPTDSKEYKNNEPYVVDVMLLNSS